MKLEGRALARARDGKRGIRAVVAAVAALAALALAAPAGAVVLTPTNFPLPGSTFQGGDGDQDNPTAPADADNPAPFPATRDWEALANLPGLVSVDDPNTLDSSFGTGSHENDPEHWDIFDDPDGTTPGKSNFFNAWAFFEDDFLYLAFDRQESGGNVFLAFELNQDTRLWTNASGDEIICRTTGDIIVSYEIQNDSTIDVIVQRWVTAVDGAVTQDDVDNLGYTNGLGCAKSGTFEEIDPQPFVQGEINRDRAIENFLPHGIDPALPTGGGGEEVLGEELFGEAALNLAGLFEDEFGDPCFSFGQFSLHGRASEADNAAMQDIVGPVPAVVRNCTIGGTKWHDLDGDGTRDQGEPVIAGYVVYIDTDNDGVLDPGEPTATTAANGAYVFENVGVGTHVVREAPDSEQTAPNQGYSCSFPDPCSHSATLDSEVSNVSGLDFGNFKPVSLTVEKQTTPDGATGSFQFTSNLAAPNDSFSLTDGGTRPVSGLDPGTYTVTETLHQDFNLTSIQCTGDADSSGAGTTATFRLTSGENVTCTFNNSRKMGQLRVQKALVPTNDPGEFDLQIDGGTVLPSAGHGEGVTQAVPTGNHSVSEAGAALGNYVSSISCTLNGNVIASGQGTSLANVPIGEGQLVTCTITNQRRNPVLTVDKTGPAFVYHGDTMTFNYEVKNTGNASLLDVELDDNKCPNVTGPTQKLGGNQDDVLDPGETWRYTCSMPVPAHSSGEANPHVNVATVTGRDNTDRPFSDTDNHSVKILHPAIAVDKTGPAAATAGSRVTFTITVTNPGDVTFQSQFVTVQDNKCEAPPALQSKRRGGGTDPTPGTLDPGDTWTYTCTVQTTTSQTAVDNVATVTGRNGRTVTDTDPHHVDLSRVAGVVRRSGTARLRGPSGCVRGPFRVTVTGQRIRSVTFLLDGRRIGVRRARAAGSRTFAITINPRGLSYGVHRVRAVIRFTNNTRPARRTLRLTFQRCPRAVIKPNFTG